MGGVWENGTFVGTCSEESSSFAFSPRFLVILDDSEATTRTDGSFVNLVKRSRVVEAAVKDVVYKSRGLVEVFAIWSVGDGESGPPSHALLQLLCNVPLATGEELSAETTLAGEGRCADLQEVDLVFVHV